MRIITLLTTTIILLITGCKKNVVSTESNTSSRLSFFEPKVVVILGSSTAFGTGATPIDSSWVNRLNYFYKDDRKNITIHNLSLGGYTTYHILPSGTPTPGGKPGADPSRNLDKALSLKPDLIIINLPSNDIAYGFSDGEIVDNYRTICSEIKRNNIQYFITSTQPRNFAEAHVRERLVTSNNAIKVLFETNMIDFYNLLSDSNNKIKPELDFGDGIHLNNKGHRIIFEEFLKDKRMRLALGY